MVNGFLSGKFSADDMFAKNDLRTVITRFSKENMTANEPLLELVRNYAEQKNCTPAQIVLAWVLAYGDFVVPIPGMRRKRSITENLGAADVVLTKEEYDILCKELSKIIIHGNRDNKDIAKLGTVTENTGK